MNTCDKITELKLKLYLEIQRDIKKYGFNNIVRKCNIPPATLSRVKKKRKISTEKLIDIKFCIDNMMACV